MGAPLGHNLHMQDLWPTDSILTFRKGEILCSFCAKEVAGLSYEGGSLYVVYRGGAVDGVEMSFEDADKIVGAWQKARTQG